MIPLNVQPAEKRMEGDGEALNIVGEPFLTIQGEGPFAGMPAVFVRLAGCNWFCKSCDTDYTSNRKDWAISDLLKGIQAKSKIGGLVVITGGEPFRQPIAKFVNKLIWNHFIVQIETNGTLAPPDLLARQVSIVCSPKTGKVTPELDYLVTAYKYILSVDNVSEEDGLPTSVLGMPCTVARPRYGFPRQNIFVQPEDTGDGQQNQKNVRACVESSLRFGYRISLQQHKLLGVD